MKKINAWMPLAAAAGAIAFAVFSAPAIASAATPPPPGTPSIQTLTATTTASPSGVHTNVVHLGTSPAACYGQTDFPHRSGTQSSVHGRTRCSFNVTQLGVTTTDWNLAWFGWNALATDSSSRTVANDSQDAHPHAGCSSTTEQSFEGTSTHYSIENGTTYTGATASIVQKFIC